MPYDKARDRYGATIVYPGDPARRSVAVVPSDTADLDPYARYLYLGVGGDVTVLLVQNLDGEPTVYKNHPAGYFPQQVRRVFATGTTATNILAHE